MKLKLGKTRKAEKNAMKKMPLKVGYENKSKFMPSHPTRIANNNKKIGPMVLL